MLALAGHFDQLEAHRSLARLEMRRMQVIRGWRWGGCRIFNRCKGCTLEDCRCRLQLLHRPGIEPGPHWPKAKHLTTTPKWQQWQVLWCAGFSTGIPPSIEAAEHGALSGLLVMRCLRGVWRRRIVPVEERLLGLGHCVWFVNITAGSPLWRTVVVGSNFCSGLGLNQASLARSKALNHYLVVAAAYFWQVWCSLFRLLHRTLF